MHTEHLTNLHPGWVVGGWLVAVAVMSAAYLAGVGAGLAAGEDTVVVWISVSMALGFFAGGLFVGLRWSDAPILHGGAITFFSVVIWFLGTLALPGQFEAWTGPTPVVLGLVLLQLLSSVAGGWMGRRMTLGGGVPDPGAPDT